MYIHAYSFIYLFIYESDVIRQILADVPFKHRLDADGSAACANPMGPGEQRSNSSQQLSQCFKSF